ncbi:hypothetical protein BK122_09540 [Paenibacillus pabuli]|nr:hypothetical protein BK122_09540 [Paenibacillus pabuli]
MDVFMKKKSGIFEIIRSDFLKYQDTQMDGIPVYLLDIYSLFDLVEIRMYHLKILHNAMFARVSGREYIGDWHLLIGNIPQFLDQYKIDIDWNKMYETLKWFLRESLIYDADHNEQLK